MKNKTSLILLTFITLASGILSSEPSWKSNYKQPEYFEKAHEVQSSSNGFIDPYSDEISGYILELHNTQNAETLATHAEKVLIYAHERKIDFEKIVSGSTSNIFYLKIPIELDGQVFYEQFGKIISWFLLNRHDSLVSLRPIFKDSSAHVFDPEQVIWMEPISARKGNREFRIPESAITDGFHIHVDYLPGQEKQASALKDAYQKSAIQHGIIYSALDEYPEKVNGPHMRAGWEVKFEKAGPTVFDRYGYSLAWLLLNHEDVPVYSHPKTWIYGENEERLISHVDSALYVGAPPELNQWFFFNPEVSSSGLYRWDSQLPMTRKPSEKESKAKIEQILSFWFGDESAEYPYEKSKTWFSKQREAKNEDFDKLIMDTFQKDLVLATMGVYSSWEDTPRGRLALIILLDQFPRNMFRGTPMAFAYDRLAITVTKRGIEAGDDLTLGYAQRLFFYLPFTHSENLEDQIFGYELHKKLLDDVPEHLKEIFSISLESVSQHVETVRKFGRLSSRNAILGRESTPDEEEFLQNPQHHF